MEYVNGTQRVLRLSLMTPQKMKGSHPSLNPPVDLLGPQAENEVIILIILSLTQAKDSNVRERTAEALGQIEDPMLARILHTMLLHQNPILRRLAVRVIGYYAHGDQMEEEVARLAEHDPDEAVRSAAREAPPKLDHKRQCFGAPA